MQSTEAQLAETTAQLQDLKSRQKLLEARNALLEKVANTQKQLDAPQAVTTASLPWQVLKDWHSAVAPAYVTVAQQLHSKPYLM